MEATIDKYFEAWPYMPKFRLLEHLVIEIVRLGILELLHEWTVGIFYVHMKMYIDAHLSGTGM